MFNMKVFLVSSISLSTLTEKSDFDLGGKYKKSKQDTDKSVFLLSSTRAHLSMHDVLVSIHSVQYATISLK